MEDITLRWMAKHEIEKLKDLDRSELVRTNYRMEAGQLILSQVDWDVPSFFQEGEGEHSVAEQIHFCQSHLERDARMCGAFYKDRLVGIGIITPEVRPGLAQLAYLHVSSGYRRKGIAKHILQKLVDWVSGEGARQIYVSATPTGSAVGFYLSQGFIPAENPLPELFDLEPEDIHMLKHL